MTSGTREVISAREAAAMVGVHPSTLARWADDGLLKCFRTPGGQRRFRRGDVEALIEAGSPGTEAAS